jgi:hypothetical protein
METMYIYPARSTKIIIRNLATSQDMFVEDGKTWKFNNIFSNLEVGQYSLSVKDSKELIDNISGIKIDEPQFVFMLSERIQRVNVSEVSITGKIQQNMVNGTIEQPIVTGKVSNPETLKGSLIDSRTIKGNLISRPIKGRIIMDEVTAKI